IHILKTSQYLEWDAVRVLGEMGPTAYQAVHALADALKSARSYEINQISDSLANIGPRAKPAVPSLLEATKNINADGTARWHILLALKSINDRSSQVVEAMKTTLSDSDPQVQSIAALTLRKWEVPEGHQAIEKQIIPSLLENLKSTDIEKRRQAANGFSQ